MEAAEANTIKIAQTLSPVLFHTGAVRSQGDQREPFQMRALLLLGCLLETLVALGHRKFSVYRPDRLRSAPYSGKLFCVKVFGLWVWGFFYACLKVKERDIEKGVGLY